MSTNLAMSFAWLAKSFSQGAFSAKTLIRELVITTVSPKF